MNAPLPYTWDGESMVPLNPRIAALCDRQYVIGETYQLGRMEGRSTASHNHQFAWLHDAWLNLPEHYAGRFPTEEHLRKFALIKAGYCDQSQFVCSSKAEAIRLAMWARKIDEYALVVATESVVTIFTAKSQSKKAMGAKDFQESKQRVLDIIAGMLDVEPKALTANGGMAA